MTKDVVTTTPISDGWTRYLESCPHPISDEERCILMFGFYTGIQHFGKTIYSHGSGDITQLLEAFRHDIGPFAAKLRAMAEAVGYEPIGLDPD